jgi:hypothetical protein
MNTSPLWRPSRGRALFSTVFISALAAAAACSSAAPPPDTELDGAGASASGGAGGSISPGSGGTIDPGPGGSGGGVVGPDGGPPGECVRIGVVGRLPTYGAVPGMDNTAALTQWLNTKSSAVVTTYATDVAFTTEFLDQYDVLIFQALEDREGGPYWTYDATEIANVETWVRAGGGIITLTGYGASSQEVAPTNQLLAFTGLSYATDDILATCADNDCCCTSNSVAVTGWNTAHPVAANITRVGAFHGRSVLGTGDVVAQGSTVFGATRQMDIGRVFVFADEWVSYTSQWDGTGAMTCAMDPAHNYCTGRLAPEYYQVPQFWYNAIKWASGDRACFDFDPDVPIVR